MGPATGLTRLFDRGRFSIGAPRRGETRITFVKDDRLAPVVSVYRFTEAMLSTMEPAEWTEVLIAQRVLAGQEFVEAGETVGSSHLLPVGLGPPIRLA